MPRKYDEEFRREAVKLVLEGGVATVHADSAEKALLRIEQMVEETGTPVCNHIVIQAVDLVIFVAREGGG